MLNVKWFFYMETNEIIGCCIDLLQDSTPVMTKIYSTLGRKFNKKDLDEAVRMGEEMVSLVHV